MAQEDNQGSQVTQHRETFTGAGDNMATFAVKVQSHR